MGLLDWLKRFGEAPEVPPAPALPVVFYMSKRKLTACIMVGVVMVVLGALGLLLPSAHTRFGPTVDWFASIAFVAIGSFMTLGCIVGLFRTIALLTVDDCGVTIGKTAPIPWRDVVDIQVATLVVSSFHDIKGVGLTVKDPGAFYAALRPWERPLWRTPGMPIRINCALLDVGADTLCAWLDTYWKRFSSH
jgi:hypothetical protein